MFAPIGDCTHRNASRANIILYNSRFASYHRLSSVWLYECQKIDRFSSTEIAVLVSLAQIRDGVLLYTSFHISPLFAVS